MSDRRRKKKNNYREVSTAETKKDKIIENEDKKEDKKEEKK